jgi:hypothetical protein
VADILKADAFEIEKKIMDTPVAPTAYAQVCTKKNGVYQKEGKNGYTCCACRIGSGCTQKKNGVYTKREKN